MARPEGRARLAQSIGAGVDPEGSGETTATEDPPARLRGLVRRARVASPAPVLVHSSLARPPPRWRQPPLSLGGALSHLPKCLPHHKRGR